MALVVPLASAVDETTCACSTMDDGTCVEVVEADSLDVGETVVSSKVEVEMEDSDVVAGAEPSSEVEAELGKTVVGSPATNTELEEVSVVKVSTFDV